MQTEITNFIVECLKNLGEELDNQELKNPNSKTKIYGEGGGLDSLALVGLVSDLEQIINDEFGKNIVLADEKMMSSRNSPFKDVQTLALYIENLLKA